MPLELVVENYFVKRVEALGGTTIKLLKLGWPDRLAILPGGRIIFAEIKRPRNGRVSAVQRVVLGTLAGLGAEVHVLKNAKEIDECLNRPPK